MKKIRLLLLGLLAACGGFSEPVYDTYDAIPYETTPATESEETAVIIGSLNHGHVDVIPREQVVSDFWLMVDTINTYSPALDALYRVFDLDLHEQAAIFYAQIPLTQNIAHFQAERLFARFLWTMAPNHIGHLGLLPPEILDYWDVSEGLVEHWTSVANGSSNVAFQPASAYKEMMSQYGIAYINMNHFRREYLYGNIREVQSFFDTTLQEKDYLIIDFSGNVGGFMATWTALFQSPFANRMSDEPMLLPAFFRDTESIRAEISDMGFVYSPTEAFDFSLFAEINKQDLENLGLVIDFTNPDNVANYLYLSEQILSEIGPASVSVDGFAGEIFLLIDGDSWSVADAVARWVRAHDFATIVGKPPGGIGASVEFAYKGGFAHFQELPYLNRVLRVDTAYGINDVGRWNDEQGTLPDIWQADGMSILGTAIDHIINREVTYD